MAKEIYFITATNTDVGKSYASEVFLNKFSSQGKKVGYYKPIETGVIDKPIDGTKLLNITKKLNPNYDVAIDDVVPYQFKLPAAPFVAKQNTHISIDKIKQNIPKLLQHCDTLIVEGAGGLMVPIEKDYFLIDLILEFQNKFNSKTILISPSNLGSINDTMLSQKALENHGINYEWYINLYKDKDSFETVTMPFYKEYFGNNINFL
ncbi:MAG: dethiobiotin synthase [Campylobacterota bacterium]|nr:dethiobiotin synthase [Campylobacterota bacterium]